MCNFYIGTSVILIFFPFSGSNHPTNQSWWGSESGSLHATEPSYYCNKNCQCRSVHFWLYETSIQAILWTAMHARFEAARSQHRRLWIVLEYPQRRILVKWLRWCSHLPMGYKQLYQQKRSCRGSTDFPGQLSVFLLNKIWQMIYLLIESFVNQRCCFFLHTHKYPKFIFDCKWILVTAQGAIFVIIARVNWC